MYHDATMNRREAPAITDEQRELERCRQEISRLRQLVVQLSEIVLRNVVESDKGRQSARPWVSE